MVNASAQVFQTRGQSSGRDKESGGWPKPSPPCSPQPHHVHWLLSWQTREGAAGRQVGSGGVGTPTAPSSGTVYTHAHAHTRPTRACTTSPTWPLGKGLVSASPIQLGRNPSSGGCGDLWLSQESPKARPSCTPPAVSRGSLDGPHNALLSALLPVNRTLWVVGKKALQERAQAHEDGSEGSGDVFVFRSQGLGLPRHGGRV